MFTTTSYHMDSLLNDLIKNGSMSTTYETGGNRYHQRSDANAYVIEVPMVGMGKEHLSIRIEDNKLHVSATNPNKGKFVTDFKQSWSLVEDIDIENIDAKLENGLLTVILPRVKPPKKTIDIKIN